MKASVLLTVPAATGLISWIAVWVFPFTPLHYNPYSAQMLYALEVIFVLMIWIGPFTSLASIVFTRRTHISPEKKIMFYVSNTSWIAFSVFALITVMLEARKLHN